MNKQYAIKKSDELQEQIYSLTQELADKVSELKYAWDEAGFSKDDAIREDLVIQAIDIAGPVLSATNTDDSDWDDLANRAARLAEDMADIRDDMNA